MDIFGKTPDPQEQSDIKAIEAQIGALVVRVSVLEQQLKQALEEVSLLRQHR